MKKHNMFITVPVLSIYSILDLANSHESWRTSEDARDLKKLLDQSSPNF